VTVTLSAEHKYANDITTTIWTGVKIVRYKRQNPTELNSWTDATRVCVWPD